MKGKSCNFILGFPRIKLNSIISSTAKEKGRGRRGTVGSLHYFP